MIGSPLKARGDDNKGFSEVSTYLFEIRFYKNKNFYLVDETSEELTQFVIHACLARFQRGKPRGRLDTHRGIL